MGWTHHFLLLCSHLNLWEMVPSFFWKERFSQNSQFLPDLPVQWIFPLDHIFLNLSLAPAPSDQCFTIFSLFLPH